MERKAYPSDISDDGWAFVAPYLTLMPEEAPQRVHSLREGFNGMRWVVRAGAPWRLMSHDLPPWEAVYQQPQRWLHAGVFQTIGHDARVVAGWRRAVRDSPRRPSSTVAPCSPRRRVTPGPAMTARNARVGARCIWRWLPWGICWLC